MARPKKILDEGEVLETSIEVSVEEEQEVSEDVAAQATKFPYKFKHPDYNMTLEVVAESTDAGGRTVLHTADGCAYTAPKA